MAYSNEDKIKILGLLLTGLSVSDAINELCRFDKEKYKKLSEHTVYSWIEKEGWKPLLKSNSILNSYFKSFLPPEVQSISKDLSHMRQTLQKKLRNGEYKINSYDKAIAGFVQLVKLELQLSGIDLSEMKRNQIMEAFKDALSEDEVIGPLIMDRWPLIESRIRKKISPPDPVLIENTNNNQENKEEK